MYAGFGLAALIVLQPVGLLCEMHGMTCPPALAHVSPLSSTRYLCANGEYRMQESAECA